MVSCGGDKVIKTSLLYWWPKIENLGIPVPKTEILEVDRETLSSVLERPWPAHLAVHVYETARKIGFPLFVRTDLASGKHAWRRSCYVPTAEILLANIHRVVEENEIHGVVGLDYRALVFREFLTLFALFTAFRGDLPIAKERRYFVRDGDVQCHHPYWAEEAVAGGRPKADGWRESLVMLNEEHESEVEILTSYSEKVAKVMEGYWSIDYAFAADGTWYLIDMAEGEKSWHPDCPIKEGR